MKIRNVISIIILVLILTLTVGFSAFVSEMSISNLVAEVRLNENVRITGVSVVSSSNGGMNSLDYDKDSILGNVNLKSSSATVTLEVEVTNFGNTVMGIESHSGSADNLVYAVSGYQEKTSLCDTSSNCTLGSVTKFNVTLGYDYYDPTVKDHEFKLDFVFKKMHSITYTDITNNGYPSYIMDGQTLSVNLGGSAPSKLDVYSDGVLLDSSMYSYVNGTLTISEVTDDIEIKEHVPVAKVVSGTLTDPGSEVCIKDECFYIISNDGTTVAMLAKYNLHVGNIVDENSNVIPIENPTGVQDVTARGAYGAAPGDFIYPFIGTTAFSEIDATYENSLVKGYIDSYNSYLKTFGIDNLFSRTMKEVELRSLCGGTISGDLIPSWVKNTSFWLDPMSSNDFEVWRVIYYGTVMGEIYSYNMFFGVRPVIEVALGEVIGPISFTIADVTYLAADGMTWEEWIESDYNTLSLACDSNGVVKYGSSAGNELEKNGSTVFASDKVVANAVYTISTSHSGGAV